MGLLQYKKGSNFEESFAETLSRNGFWCTVIPKKRDGSQPFDIVAGKNGKLYTFDCKTSKSTKFQLSRIEDNQERAFGRLAIHGCYNNYFAISVDNAGVYIIEAEFLIDLKNSGEKYIDVTRYINIQTFLLGVK